MRRDSGKKRLSGYFYLFCVLEGALCIVASIVLRESNMFDLRMAEMATGWLACLNLLLFTAFMSHIRGSILSVAFLFVLFMYLFNLGVPIARAFGWVDASQELALLRRVYIFGDQSYRYFSLYGFLLIAFLQIGIMSKGKIPVTTAANKPNEYLYSERLRLCRSVGLILIVIGFLPFVSLELSTIRHAVAYGYHNTSVVFDVSGSGRGLFAGLFTVGFFFVLVGVHRNRKAFNCLFILMMVYQAMRMFLTGDRSTGVMMIFVLVVARHALVARIRGIRVLFAIAAVYAGLIALKYIELTRTHAGLSSVAAFQNVIQGNAFSQTVGDYGTNIWNGLMVYVTVPSDGIFRCGLTYIAAIIGKPLQILGITDAVWEFADYSNYLKEPIHSYAVAMNTASMGGSFSGEWYFNFGWFGLVIIPLFGRLLAKLSDLCSSIQSDPCVNAFSLYIATLVLWWVRQYFTSVSWYAVFYGAAIFIIYSIIKEFTDSANRRRRRGVQRA